MKAGFKPKLWTKKEWLDADPSDKTKGCGVEAALDEWQKNCKGAFASMKPEEAAKASMTAHKLSEVLTKASKKCDPKAQKETLMGINEYKKRADDYAHLAKLAAVALVNRQKFNSSMTGIDPVMQDKDAAALFKKYAEKAQIWPAAHTLQLFEQKKYEEAVSLYGGKSGNDDDFNISLNHLEVLRDTFRKEGKVRHEQKDILSALQAVIKSQKQMLGDGRIWENLKSGSDWKSMLSQRFPLKEYLTA